jgi:hypothetical protein
MFKQRRLERQVEQGFVRYLSHMEAIGESDALRVFNTFNQHKLERQVERRLAAYVDYADTYLNHKREAGKDRVIKIDTLRVIRLDLEERRQQLLAARSHVLTPVSLRRDPVS